MKEYDEATLRKLQKLELGILKDVDRICRELNIKYFAIGGTALGAKRHGGFIPWDDDVDIGMLRDDMDRLLKYIRRNCNDKYIIINNDEYDDFPFLVTQLALRTTSFVNENSRNMNIPFGIYLDIFPFDNIPDNFFLRFYLQITKRILVFIAFVLQTPKPQITIKGKLIIGWKRKVIYAITSLIYYLLKVLQITNKKMYIKMYNLSTKYSTKRTKWISFPAFYDQLTMEFSDVFPVKNCKFEDMEIMIPNSIEKHLTRMYGDYMQLPPIEKRKNHSPIKLDFGIYTDKNLDNSKRVI